MLDQSYSLMNVKVLQNEIDYIYSCECFKDLKVKTAIFS